MAFLQAVSAKNDNSYRQARRYGGQFANNRVTDERVKQTFDSFKQRDGEIYPDKYRILEAYMN